MQLQDILLEVKNSLKSLYRTNLVEIILYGSYARNDYNRNSDIDLLVVLKKVETVGKEIDKIIDAIYDINLKYQTLISVVPISLDDYRNLNSPLILNIRREGVTVE